jgi:hypothetical protein
VLSIGFKGRSDATAATTRTGRCLPLCLRRCLWDGCGLLIGNARAAAISPAYRRVDEGRWIRRMRADAAWRVLPGGCWCCLAGAAYRPKGAAGWACQM